MNGVIVHTEHIYRDMPISSLIAVIVLCAVAIGFATVLYSEALKKKPAKKWIAHIEMGVVVVLVILLVAAAAYETQVINKEQVVTIDDSVGFNEFFDRYEIISVDGNLYTVREIETENTEPEVITNNE